MNINGNELTTKLIASHDECLRGALQDIRNAPQAHEPGYAEILRRRQEYLLQTLFSARAIYVHVGFPFAIGPLQTSSLRTMNA